VKAEDDKLLMHCFVGCRTEDVVAAMGLGMADLFADRNGRHGGGGSSIPPKTAGTMERSPAKAQDAEKNGAPKGIGTPSDGETGCTLEDYAEAKGLPVEFLRRQGLRDQKHQGRPAVRIPYRGVDGSERAVRFRVALEKDAEGDDRFRWRTGSKAGLYGLWKLERIREAGYVVLVEGESDAHTLWYHGVPALGIPGAGTWRKEWSEHLEGVEKVYAVVEPDGGGERLRERLVASEGIKDRLHLVGLGEHEDPSGLYLAYREAFAQKFSEALAGSVPLVDLERETSEAVARGAWSGCKDLARTPDILGRFAAELARSGVAGESRVAKLLYLAVTSRFLDRPVSVAVKGPSSGGKSYLTERVLGFFPEDAFYALTAMSERALAYSEEPLRHRFLVVYEAAGMSGDFATYLIRSLLSEGRLRYEVVEKTSEGLKPRLIEREGPTGLLVTTTAVKLHPENETRLLSLTVTDTNQQTRDVMAALAGEAAREAPDLDAWHALQTWLGAAEHRVAVPYAGELARTIPPVAVRLRRDFGAVLNLIRAHATLHQASRERDAEGRVVATLGDYARVRELVADLVSEGVEATVPAVVRETVDTLARLHAEESEPVTIVALAKALKLDKSAAWRRVRTAMDRGYVKNLEDKKGRPARLVLGDALPDDIEILPAPERLRGCTVAGDSGGIKNNNICEPPGERPDGPQNDSFPYPPGTSATVQPATPVSSDLEPGDTTTLEELKRSREENGRERFAL
jgi:hypothetical protein